MTMAMTIKEALKKYNKVEIDLLLAHVLKKPREFLFMNPGTRLTIKQAKNLAKSVRRRLEGEPIAYILGYKDFYGLRFKVGPGVLIPRPETEWLVEKTIKRLEGLKLKDSGRKIRILDVGTGSGCIIISIAKGLGAGGKKPKLELFGSDISTAALKIARQNAKQHGVKAGFAKSDLLRRIRGGFDVILANLPYVPVSDYKKLLNGLKYEPKAALTDNTDKFALYESLCRQISPHLNPGGAVLLEIDPKARAYLQKWVKKYLPKGRAEFYKDFRGLWRYAEISRQAAGPPGYF